MKSIALLFCLVSFKVFSQSSNLENLIKIVEQETMLNIYSYNIVKMYENSRFIDSNGFFKNGLLYNDLYRVMNFPNFGLKLTAQSPNYNYPDTNYSLIEFSIPKIEYQDYCDSSHSILVGISDLPIKYSRVYLVAFPHKYQGNNPTIKFISGSFVKTRIWNDFKYRGLTVENMTDFIKLKCYNLGIDAISYVRKDKSWAYFDVFLKDRNEKRQIRMSIKNPDIVMLMFGQEVEWRNDGTYAQGLLGG